MKDQIRAAILAYELGELDFPQLQDRIGTHVCRPLDRYALDHYWRSQSLEDFVGGLLQPPIAHWENIDAQEVLRLLEWAFEDLSLDARLQAVCEALEKRYGLAAGAIIDFIFQEDLDPTAIVERLGNGTGPIGLNS